MVPSVERVFSAVPEVNSNEVRKQEGSFSHSSSKRALYTSLERTFPAATISCGGVSGGTHDISEWYDPTDAYQGVQKNLLCVLALTGVEGLAEPLISKTQTA